MRVGIVGIGGLGQMGVMLAKAMGNTVTAISTSPNKEGAAKEIGADKYMLFYKNLKFKQTEAELGQAQLQLTLRLKLKDD